MLRILVPAIRGSCLLLLVLPLACGDGSSGHAGDPRDSAPSRAEVGRPAIDGPLLMPDAPSADGSPAAEASPPPAADAADIAAPDDGGADAAADLRPIDARVAEAGVPDGPPPAAQVPPQGRRLLDPWLAAGHYRSWSCEPAVMNPRPGSPHGRNRVCSNDLASGHGAGPYPVGAAAVKEIYYGARIGVYAVSIKIKAGSTGDAWYWYEQNDLEGVGVAGCAGCHGRAERSGGNDYMYIQVK